MKTVLLIEDSASWQQDWALELRELGIRDVQAFSLEEAHELLLNLHPNPGIDAIVWDGELCGTYSFDGAIQAVKASGFTGPMIAASGSPSYREQQMEAGCTHEADKDKVVELLTELLGP